MRTLARGLSAGLLAVGLSLGMVVQSAPPAQAFAPAPVIPPLLGAITGGAEGGAIAAGGLCATGVGCVVVGAAAVAGLGLLAYANRDTIARWGSNLLGIGDDGGGVAHPDQSGTGASISAHIAGDSVIFDGPYEGQGRIARGYVCRTAGGSIWAGRQSADLGPPFDKPQPGVTLWGPNDGEGGTPGQCAQAGGHLIAHFLYIGGRGQNGVEGWPAHLVDSWTTAEYAESVVSWTYTTCLAPDGSHFDIPATVGPATTQASMEAVIPACNVRTAGAVPSHIRVVVPMPGLTSRFYREYDGQYITWPPISAWEWSLDESALASDYAECMPGTDGCELKVRYRGGDCTVGATGCVDWWTRRDARPQDYACLWGPYSVPLVTCSGLKHAYTVGAVADPDGADQRYYAPGTDVGSADQRLADPDPAPGPDPEPDPDPTATGGASPTPTPTSTGADPSPTPTPVTDPNPGPPDDGQCDIGWSLGNVLNGTVVYQAVGCALVWAFVPPDGFAAEVQTFRDAWDGSGIGTWVGQQVNLPNNAVAGLGGGGCGGPQWTIGLGGRDYPFRPLDACHEPMASIAPVVKGIAGALVLIVGAKVVSDPVLQALGLPRIPGRYRLSRSEVDA